MTQPKCEVEFTTRHTRSWWRITAHDGRVIVSCGAHLDALLYLDGVNRVERIEERVLVPQPEDA